MLLNALIEPANEVLGRSLYAERAPTAAACFLYGVAVIAVVAFIAAVVMSFRAAVDDEAARK